MLWSRSPVRQAHVAVKPSRLLNAREVVVGEVIVVDVGGFNQQRRDFGRHFAAYSARICVPKF
jgi:hypothetical protein